MVQYTMHDLVHDLATLIIGDELMVSSVASKRTNAHRLKYCRYALVTKYDQATKLSSVLPSKVRALHFQIAASWISLVGHFHLQNACVFWILVDAQVQCCQSLLGK